MGEALFSTPFHTHTESVKQSIGQAIERMSEGEIRTTGDALLEGLLAEYHLQPVVLDWDKTIQLTGRRERKEVVHDTLWGESVEAVRQIYTFEVAYSGSRSLLYIKPSTSRLWRFEPRVDAEVLHFDITDQGSEQANKAALQSIKGNLEHDITHLNSGLDVYHSEIAAFARNALQQRKERIESAVQGMGGFGVPVRGLNLEPQD